jgi:NAD(P)-dependent dehydrogenase (short-subunit alcohol dehydrogenase family)
MGTKLLNKTVLITGGLSGIGHACAIAAAHEGANIVIADLKTEGMELAMQEIIMLNPEAIFISCNVANESEVENVIKETMLKFKTLDIALNNAGIGGDAFRIGDMPLESWEAVIDVNLNGVFYCMKHELIQMYAQKCGNIINMASILGKVGFAMSSHYVAAKHAVIGLTETAALEYAPSGIRINAICPGFILTPLLTNSGIQDNTAIKQQIIDLHPIKRLGTSNEIACAFMFLACDENTFMNGASLAVDGGYLAQ